ncbi:MAG: N-acetyltransferase [Anaerolineae bacterium]|jgi:hypothetical protein|nr:N-acetyltransferase [Anaerolineae bacterium]
MKVEPPAVSSYDEIKVNIREIEAILSAPPMELPPWPEAMITLPDGRTVYIRAIQESDIRPMLGYLEQVMKVEKDFYDIVGVRVYGEVLALLRKRMKDPFTMVGLVDGEWLGFANGRVWDKTRAISLHTLTFSRRAKLGWPMYYAKTYYAMEILKVDEWWSTFESYNGWRMAGLSMAQPTKPYPEYQHELGGAKVFYLNQDMWQGRVKNYIKEVIGEDLNFKVTNAVRKANATFRVPETLDL